VTTVVQIAPDIGPGSGVGGVAHHLEAEWLRTGLDVRRFTMTEARGSWLPEPGPGWRGKAALAARVVWFSTVGTVLARSYLRSVPGAVSVCHNDAVVGDVYVNHGILKVAMRARGGYAWRMMRNPMHLFTAARDSLRYRSNVHRVVVNLISEEDVALRDTYPALRPPTVVIGNGVDVERFAPPTEAQRRQARDHVGLRPDDVAVLFVGHEFDRKGLPLVLDAMAGAPERFHLVVVGGTADLVAKLRRSAESRGLAQRLHTVGQVTDPVPYFHAADVFVMPSAYESYGLVVLEALACGVPVVATGVGCVPDVVRDGVDGFVVDRDPEGIRAALLAVAAADRPGWARAARSTAEEHSWTNVASAYLDLLRSPLVTRAPAVGDA
jgi:UDP-glucose:(heptosyl)LPS alpha-1,3-glucosyltransferase